MTHGAAEIQSENMMFSMELWNEESERKSRSFPCSPVRAILPMQERRFTPSTPQPEPSRSKFWPSDLELRGRQEEWNINIEV
jgi:hypothetical protein